MVYKNIIQHLSIYCILGLIISTVFGKNHIGLLFNSHNGQRVKGQLMEKTLIKHFGLQVCDRYRIDGCMTYNWTRGSLSTDSWCFFPVLCGI